jgi:tetratricopeptide (TPR) repeat protein
MSYVYEGKSRSAVVYLDSLSADCGEEPFYLLIKSRVARELLTIDDENKERVIADSEPLHRDLDRVIEVCTQRMDAAREANDDDVSGAHQRWRLYRGLAWMSKSHLCSFSHRYWRAGRDAKKGKSDLERYLETNPDDPLATGTSGVFLYFADMISTVLKFFSKLVFMPTGDREKGLRYIATAATEENVYQLDFQLVQCNINLLFEGRYEDGLDGASALLRQHRSYPRLAIPLALIQPFSPFDVHRNAADIDEMLLPFDNGEFDELAESGVSVATAGFSENGPGGSERYVLALLDFLNAYADRFVAPPEVAEAGLRRVANNISEGPDWIGAYAAFELGRLLASQGRNEEARTVFSWVRQNRAAAFLRDDAELMARTLDDGARETIVLKPSWITGIYFGDPEEREITTRELRSVSPPSTQINFYLGDALLLAGDTDGALASYIDVLELDADPWNEEFKMIAASRVAEIHGARGDYEAAAESLDRALQFYRKEYLVDWMLEGRRRYYEKLDDGNDLPVPRVFTPTR